MPRPDPARRQPAGGSDLGPFPARHGQPSGGGPEPVTGEPVCGPPARKRQREATPSQRALGLLVRREHSRRELLTKLTSRGIDPRDAGEAVDRMTSEGWQDDARFAASLARMRAHGGYGPVRIRAELDTHRIGSEAVEAALSAQEASGDADWLAQARDLVLRRYGAEAWSDTRLRRKAADFLFRRGFESDCVREATRPEA